MKLYLLTRKEHVGYDENGGGVVRAESPRAARQMMSELSGDENEPCEQSPWLDGERSTCRELKDGGKAGVVLVSFRAG